MIADLIEQLNNDFPNHDFQWCWDELLEDEGSIELIINNYLTHIFIWEDDLYDVSNGRYAFIKDYVDDYLYKSPYTISVDLGAPCESVTQKILISKDGVSIVE